MKVNRYVYRKQWIRRWRSYLRRQLGARCSWCQSTRKLEFDVLDSSDETHHRYEHSWRISFYRRMFANHNLQLLCDKCHGRKSAAALTAYEKVPLSNSPAF